MKSKSRKSMRLRCKRLRKAKLLKKCRNIPEEASNEVSNPQIPENQPKDEFSLANQSLLDFVLETILKTHMCSLLNVLITTSVQL